jgi:Ca2+-binding EF-hand superfamily protein
MTSALSLQTLEELLMKKGLIANSLTDHPLIIRLREVLAEKSGITASLFIEIERIVEKKKSKGDKYFSKSEFTSLITEKSSSMLSAQDIQQLFNAFSSDKPDNIFTSEFMLALKGIYKILKDM